MKPTGIKLNMVSGAELAVAIICFLIALPFASDAYHNFRTRSAYRTGVGFYTGRDFMKAREQFDLAVEHGPEAFYPQELLAMAYFHQGDQGQAEKKFKRLTDDPLLNGHERALLAEIALNSLRLLELKKKAKVTDSDYLDQVVIAKKLGGKRGFLESRLVKLQTMLDTLVVATGVASRRTRELTLDTVLTESRAIEKQANKGKPLSPRGMSVLYNTLGLANFERGVIIWDQISIEDRAKKVPTPRMITAAKYTADGVIYFRKAIQYKTYWAPPFINFERAMGYKLVEDGMTAATRRKWVALTLTYNAERDEQIGFIRTMGLKPEKELPLIPSRNRYVLYCGLGWAYALLEEWNLSQSYLGLAMRLAKRGKTGEPYADLLAGRSASRYWKRFVELEIASRDSRFQSRRQAKVYLEEARKVTAGPRMLMRLRVLNNQAIFLVLSGAGVIDGAERMKDAVELVNKLKGAPAFSKQVGLENLTARTLSNGRAIEQYLRKLRPNWQPDMRALLDWLKANCGK